MAPTTRSTTRAAQAAAQAAGQDIPPLYPRPARRTLTALQRTRNINSGKVSKTWPITRRNKQSRGIFRDGNTCYRLSVLQSLLHTPKFLNLMLEHNQIAADEVITNACTPQSVHEQNARVQCIACSMKGIIRGYWGRINLDGNGAPRPIPRPSTQNEADQPLAFRTAFTEFNNWVDFWIRNPNGEPSPTNKKETDDENRDSDAQHDAHAFLMLLLDGCFRATSPAGLLWHDKFEGLFRYNPDVLVTCSAPDCGVRRNVSQPPGSWGITPIHILQTGTDSISQALDRHLRTHDWDNSECPTCNSKNTHQTTERIEAGPEVFFIHLNLSGQGLKGDIVKIRAAVGLDEDIDLTGYQLDPSTPLRYTLSSVVLHAGNNLTSGHWVATTTAYGKKCVFLNDSQVRVEDKAFLLSNPSTVQGSQHNVAILGYTRIHFPKRMLAELA
ncbi:cysteine proteinase [Amniculicola lignicola CBS 123094]|uniref:Cysteine proteinase n=1 Tax=Amniculicola lignicola CBS 123094 TaxID=1392246 RepID=A0A6A5WHP5_9PLEO|nr:cysteine proteinase [Amniculicola lignicola CBS 123094]